MSSNPYASYGLGQLNNIETFGRMVDTLLSIYEVNKNDLLIKQKADMQDHVKGFLDVQQNFVTEFGGEKGRLTNISQRDRLARILNFDEIFRFGVDSISDEFLDPQEYEAYKNALDYKDSSYIKLYISSYVIALNKGASVSLYAPCISSAFPYGPGKNSLKTPSAISSTALIKISKSG